MEKTKTANEIVKLARQADRVTSLEFIDMIFDSFIELHGDRYYGDDGAVVGGIAYLDSLPVTVIGVQKGRTLEENIATNFGSPSPEGYRKSLRLMKQAEKFNRPVITFVNTAGAYCGVEAENRGQGEAIARNLIEMSKLKVPILSIIIGEGGSGGALALAMGNQVWMMEHTMYSVLSPEGFSSILWKDASRSKEAAELMKLTAQDLFGLDVIDFILPETNSEGLLSHEQILENMRDNITSTIKELSAKKPEELVEERYQRFRKY